MRNDYEDGTTCWLLIEEAERLAKSLASANEQANAIDRLVTAHYRIGAGLISALEYIGKNLGDVADNVGALQSH